MEQNTKKALDDFLAYAANALADIREKSDAAANNKETTSFINEYQFQAMLQVVQKVMEVQAFLNNPNNR